MSDRISKAARSRLMAAIHSTGNRSTEEAMRRLLRANKLRGWRRHVPIQGHPDFTWHKERVALFVDGCFWHGCPRCYRPPSSRADYWRAKISRTKRRDRRSSNALRAEGWMVLRVWECELRDPRAQRRLAATIRRLITAS